MQRQYQITPSDRERTHKPRVVTAESHDEAATAEARRRYGKAVHARRTTGDAGKSGYFQTYAAVAGSPGTYSSRGESFHVAEV